MNMRVWPNRWFHRHPKPALSALALLICLVLIILLEIAARIFAPQWAPPREERVKFWSYDERLGWAHVPGRRGRFNHRDFSVGVAINSHGMRDDEYPMNRTGKRRMLVIGDSFAWGFGVEHEERFSEILEKAHPGWEIINASVSGYGTDQQFLFLREKGMAFKPDVVLLLFCPNDFENNIHAEQYWYFKPYFVDEGEHLQLRNVPVPEANISQLVKRILLGRTYLGNIISNAIWVLRSSLRSRAADGDENSNEEREKYNVTFHIMRDMNILCREAAARFVLVSAPMDADDRTFMQQCAEGEGIPYLQLDEYFDSEDIDATFLNDEHWNAGGHAIAADAIDRFLLELGLFGPVGRRE